MIAQPVLDVAAITHRGAVRDSNEDSVLVGAWLCGHSIEEPLAVKHVLSEPLICVVADGIGGHAAGAEASRRVATTLLGATVPGMREDDVKTALEQANSEVYAAAAANPDFAGMGSTVAGIVFQPDGLIWFNVGDSRVYRYRDGFLRQLSIDDVPVGHDGDRRTGVITRSLGGSFQYTPVVAHVEAEPLVVGWQYLLCSDGLTDMVDVNGMERILQAHPPGVAVNALFKAAMAAGRRDNISIILVSVGAGGVDKENNMTKRDDAPGAWAWLTSVLAEPLSIVRPFSTRGFEADLYLVADPKGHEWVAKMYPRGITPRVSVLERIRDADRRHVVGLEAFGSSDGQWWELLEYVPHGTLHEWFKQRGRPPDPALVRTVLRELAAALEYLHGLDIVHRDLKPGKVLVRRREPLDLVLTDFGIASAVEGTDRITGTARTLKYAPPEAMGTFTVDEHGRAQNVSEVARRWDYWSLGMILVEVLTGCHPFDHADDAAIGRRLATMDTDELSEAVSDPAWRTLCCGLLRRDPDHRWGAAQVAQWLRDPNHPSMTVAVE